MLNRLKRQHDIADLIRLAVPNQLDLPFVVKQQTPILLRQRLPRLQMADDVLLLGVSQSGYEITRGTKTDQSTASSHVMGDRESNPFTRTVLR